MYDEHLRHELPSIHVLHLFCDDILICISIKKSKPFRQYKLFQNDHFLNGSKGISVNLV